MAKEKQSAPDATRSGRKVTPKIDIKIQEYARLQGMMLYNLMTVKSAMVPFTSEVMELNKIGMSVDPKALVTEWAERQKSAVNFQRFIGTYGKQLFGSAVYAGEQKLAENDMFRLTHIPVKPGVTRRASMFHIGGFIPYSDNLFRLLPKANFYDRFIENGIDVYEMKLKCDSTAPNPHLLDLTVEKIIESIHRLSDVAFEHAGRQRMILEGYCGTGIHTYASYLADPQGMDRKFKLILTFVSPIDARKCTIFEQMHEILAYLNPEDGSVDGLTISSLLDTIQERVFDKTPLGALVFGWKNKEYAKIEKIEDLTHRQQSELAAWYWLSLEHGSYYPLSKDLYTFYSRLFMQGVSRAGVLPYEYKGHVLNLKDLKKTGVRVLTFLGDKDHLVDCRTADVLKDILGGQCEIVIHEKTGHVAYIFNPTRWDANDPRAFKPGIFETIFRNLPEETALAGATAKPKAKKAAPAKAAPAKAAPAKAAPAKATPAKATPAKATPAKATPAKATPAKATPAKATPAKATPAKATPAKATPAKAAPAKAAPAKATPAKATPAKATPAKATPAKATPAKAAPAKAAEPVAVSKGTAVKPAKRSAASVKRAGGK